MVYSFDIFDTCLVRKCGTTSAFFDILASRVFDNDVSASVRLEFISNRKEAENRCSVNPQSTIKDIYDVFDFCYSGLHTNELLVRDEISLEEEMLVPVLDIREKITSLRNKGNSILFISDMYLPSEVLAPILRKYDLLKDGDGLYISCEVGQSKSTGALYEYVHNKENIPYNQWKHYGDNYLSDYVNAKRFGIKSHLVKYGYSPYSSVWQMQSVGSNCAGLLSSLSRTYCLNTCANERTALIVDIIAPFYCSIVYLILCDAKSKGFTDLFFCARDTFYMYKIAQSYQSLFPDIKLHYLRISRDALYKGNREAGLLYFVQEGFASNDKQCALVDMTSTGKTLTHLNSMFDANGFSQIFGYFVFKYDKGADEALGPDMYYCFFRQNLTALDYKYANVFDHLTFIENFFSTNTELRTVNYEIINGEAVPVLGKDDGETSSYQPNAEKWCPYYEKLICQYVSDFLLLNLHEHSDVVLSEYIFPTLCNFLFAPDRKYLEGVRDFLIFKDGAFVPYVKDESFVRLLHTRGKDSGWSRGTLTYNLPSFVTTFLKHLR